MNDAVIARCEAVLEEMAGLLFEENRASPWGGRVASLAGKKTLHADDFRRSIKGLFGGMGSLNDLVLLRHDGSVNREDSRKFAALREELYNLVTYKWRS